MIDVQYLKSKSHISHPHQPLTFYLLLSSFTTSSLLSPPSLHFFTPFYSYTPNLAHTDLHICNTWVMLMCDSVESSPALLLERERGGHLDAAAKLNVTGEKTPPKMSPFYTWYCVPELLKSLNIAAALAGRKINVTADTQRDSIADINR